MVRRDPDHRQEGRADHSGTCCHQKQAHDRSEWLERKRRRAARGKGRHHEDHWDSLCRELSCADRELTGRHDEREAQQCPHPEKEDEGLLDTRMSQRLPIHQIDQRRSRGGEHSSEQPGNAARDYERAARRTGFQRFGRMPEQERAEHDTDAEYQAQDFVGFIGEPGQQDRAGDRTDNARRPATTIAPIAAASVGRETCRRWLR
jgi:hypothetical protein